MYALFKKEINTFFSQNSGVIIILSYLLINGAFLWLFSSDFNILDSGFTQMNGLFSLSPFLFLVFIPALTMRLFADEYKEGTIEVLQTSPISNTKLVLSKYFSGLTLVFLAIIPTLVYYFSLSKLSETVGNIDTAGIIGSYIGLLLLSSVFVAIGIYASSTTKNQITSFIKAIFISAFFYLGWDLIANEIANGKIQIAISYLGMDSHYNSLSRGVIDSRDIIYYLILNIIFIQLTSHSISRKK
jgi:ABC-2 type transport system permease protein